MTGRTRASLRMRLVTAVLRASGTKKTLADAGATERARLHDRPAGPAAPSRRVRRGHRITHHEHGGTRWVELVRRDRRPELTIVYVHGGAYISPAVVHHWNLMAALAEENNARVVAPLYRLAPEGTAATAVPAMVALHLHLTGDPATPPVWAGDSAGGGLALATAMRLRDEGLPLPRHLVLFAPWLDVRLRNPAIAELVDLDPTLNPPGLRYAGRLWAGELDEGSPQVSPVEGDATGLPPTTVIVGTHDLLLADCREFAGRAKAAGVDIELSESPGGFHVYPAATFLPESVEARRLVSARLKAGGS